MHADSTLHIWLQTWAHRARLRPNFTRNGSIRSRQACRGVCTLPACFLALRQTRACPRQLPRGTRRGQAGERRARSSACSAWPQHQPPVQGQRLTPAWRGGAPRQPPASAAAWRRGLLPCRTAAQLLRAGALDGARLGPRPCRWVPSSRAPRPCRAAAHSGTPPVPAGEPLGAQVPRCGALQAHTFLSWTAYKGWSRYTNRFLQCMRQERRI
jgi:hypothetical protein